MNLETVDELLTTTRAVRRRLDLDRPVDLSVVKECLELALQAPTRGNSQEWRWVIITDPAIRRAVADVYRSASMDIFTSARDRATDDATRRAYSGALYLAEVLDQVPVLVVPCMPGRVDGLANDRTGALYASIYPAVWSFQLALRSRGLGSALTTVHLKMESEIGQLLGIPYDVTQTALIPVGQVTGDGFRPADRRSVAEVAYLNRWGSAWDPEP